MLTVGCEATGLAAELAFRPFRGGAVQGAVGVLSGKGESGRLVGIFSQRCIPRLACLLLQQARLLCCAVLPSLSHWPPTACRCRRCPSAGHQAVASIAGSWQGVVTAESVEGSGELTGDRPKRSVPWQCACMHARLAWLLPFLLICGSLAR